MYLYFGVNVMKHVFPMDHHISFSEENIDFEVLAMKKKTSKQLDNNLLQDVLKKKFSNISTNNNVEEKNTIASSTGKKRSFADDFSPIGYNEDDEDMLKYSDDDDEIDKNEKLIEGLSINVMFHRKKSTFQNV